MNRSGFPGHLEPWRQFSDVEVDLVKVQVELHKVGYNVLSYDMHNHGMSGSANAGVVGVGLLELRDVIGAMKCVQGDAKLKQMTLG